MTRMRSEECYRSEAPGFLRLEVDMEERTPPSTRPLKALQWAARIIGTLFVVMFLTVFVVESVQKGGMQVERGRVAMLIFLFLSFVGLIAAWKWEGLGGALALGSLVVFAILGHLSGGKPGGTIVVCAMYGLPALLFLLHWWWTRGEARRGHETTLST